MATAWTVEVDALGAFQPPGMTPAESAAAGNYRIQAGDKLIVTVPAGTLVNQKNVTLKITPATDESLCIQGTEDYLGHKTFEWQTTVGQSGPCLLCVEYDLFNQVGSESAQQTRVDSTTRQSGLENCIIVEPPLILNGSRLPFSSVSMQTILSRCLGSMDTWVDKIKNSSTALNYNVLHLTPVQLTGESGSMYSLANQLKLEKRLLPSGFDGDEEQLLRSTVAELENECRVLTVTDIVLNHTALNTEWVPDHPECGYNEKNSPHLKAAIELDLKLQQFSEDLAEGKFADQGIEPLISNETELSQLRVLMNQRVIKPFHMSEWFEIDIKGAVDTLIRLKNEKKHDMRSVREDPKYERLIEECLRHVGVARHHGVKVPEEFIATHFTDRIALETALRHVQEDLFARAEEVEHCILSSIEGYVRWERLECKRGPIEKSFWNSLIPRYFTPIITKSGETLHLANNGWVMNWDARVDFASPGCLVYLSRSVVVWSDCIKLRYGDSEKECPYLWSLMRQYCERSARIFHGLRLDNCHSTPLHVAKYMLDCCRKVNPAIWVYAELFTGKREVDLHFERTLGLNALVREAMQSYSTTDFAHHVREFSGRPVGALDTRPSLLRYCGEEHPPGGTSSAVGTEAALLGDPQGLQLQQPLLPSNSPSIFFDCTHDNETPAQKRDAVDALPSACVVSAATCAIGSSRGYDELVPKTLSVVDEKRNYVDYSSTLVSRDESPSRAPTPVGIISTSMRLDAGKVSIKGSWDSWAKPIELEKRIGVWVTTLPEDFVPKGPCTSAAYQFKFIANEDEWFHDPASPTVTDDKGNVNNAVVIWSLSTFDKAALTDPSGWEPDQPLPGIMEARKVMNDLHTRLGLEGFSEIKVDTRADDALVVSRHNPHTHERYFFFARCAFNKSSTAFLSKPAPFFYSFKGKVTRVLMEAKLKVAGLPHYFPDKRVINGLPSHLDLVTDKAEGDVTSSFNMFELDWDPQTNESTVTLRDLPAGSVVIMQTESFRHVYEGIAKAIRDLDSIRGVCRNQAERADELHAYSYALYSCSREELDRSKGKRGCYQLANEELPYAGIAGFIPVLDRIRYTGDQNHPLAENIKAGDWLFDYLADRLDTDKDVAFSGGVVVILLKLASWLRETFAKPLRHLPRELLLDCFDWIVSSLYSWIGKQVMKGVVGPLKDVRDPMVMRLCLATLQVYSFVPSAPLMYGTNHPSLSAGLPHFSTEYMRNWGRDTFLAFRGCLLVTGRFQEARDEILGFARVMRHALIPNLLDGGNNPRYNARDATWLLLQAIQDYCMLAPEGSDFLKAPIDLKYKAALPPDAAPIETLSDLLHFIMYQHAKGIEFREWNAGPKIDCCMKEEGFNIKITFDADTGFIYGGNVYNCGTWMDKMGSSEEAGTIGVPATPRDGAAVEIVGLLKSTLRFVNGLPKDVFPYEMAHEGLALTYQRWEQLLTAAFEKIFFVQPSVKTVKTEGFDSKLVNHVNILRDTYRASTAWMDYQLRPNCCVTLAVAPELLTPDKVGLALQNVSDHLFCARPTSEMQSHLDVGRATYGRSFNDVIERMGGPQYGTLSRVTPQLGLKTLDRSDYNYRPFYNNDDRSTDPSISHGQSYHNGPEWVWPVGYFLSALFRAKSQGAAPDEDSLEWARYSTMRFLLQHRRHLAEDPWISLPELTDEDARFNPYSCTAQAWSIGTILSFLFNAASSTRSPNPSSSSSS